MTTPEVLPDPSLPWPICREAVDLIAEVEGLQLRAYKCPAGVWTIGWGETEGVTPDMMWTKEHADQRLLESLRKRVDEVMAMCTVTPTQPQLAALVSLGYNIGMAALRGSSVMKAHNENRFEAAANAFGLWNKARVQGKLTVLAGLVARRAREAALYLAPAGSEPLPLAMAQAVVGEIRLAKSPINIAGIVTAATGVIGALSSQSADVQQIVTQVQGVAVAAGIPPSMPLSLLLLSVGVVIVYRRWQQRRDGSA